MTNGPLFEIQTIPFERPDAIASADPALPPLRALFHRSSTPTRDVAIYVQTGFMGAPLTGRHDYRPLALALDAVDCSLLVLQNSAARRPQYVRFDTCADDLQRAIGWAKARGFDNIALIGVSLGGVRISYWNAVAPDPAVKIIVFLAAMDSIYSGREPQWTDAQRSQENALLQRCRDLIATGNGDQLVVGELAGIPFPMAAEAYLSYFGEPGEIDASSLKHASRITVPTLFIHGTEDIVCPPQDAQRLYDALGTAPKKEFMWFEGCPHQTLTPGVVAETVSAKIADFVARNL